MHLMFKDWNPARDLSPKVVAAEKLLQRNVATFHRLGLDLTGGLAQGVLDGAPWAVHAMHELATTGVIGTIEADLKSHLPASSSTRSASTSTPASRRASRAAGKDRSRPSAT